jgi:large subunit ribosomal protein L10
MPKPEKIEAVDKLKQLMNAASSVFVTDYTGLNVEEITKLRKELRDNSIKYLVAKNTLLKIAATDSGLEKLNDFFQGQTGLAFGADDPSVAAKILYNSFKSIEKPVIKAFVLDKEFYPGSEITRLADLPSKEVLYSMVVAAVESPLTSLVASIDGVFQELVATLEALQKTKE